MEDNLWCNTKRCLLDLKAETEKKNTQTGKII